MTQPQTDQPAPLLQTHRRGFLRGAVSTGGVLALASGLPFRAIPPAAADETPETGLPDGLDPAFFHVYSSLPLTAATRRSAFGMGVVTPQSRFFIRNNLPMPSADILNDRDAWKVEVAGAKKSGSLSLAKLKKMGVATVTTVIQCSGNGRAFFEHDPSGSPWEVGAAGCAIWTGLPVRTLLEAFGDPNEKSRYLTGTGGEPLPDGIDPLSVVVERSIPLEKGIQDCLLAWEMNGVPIPLTHGGPLRLIVPGYFGCNQIKYIRKLACTETESPAKIQQTGYRMRPIGEKASPAQPSLWRMPVTSWLQGPNTEHEPILQGETLFHGVAFSGERNLQKIEFSLDDGKTWDPVTQIGPEMGTAAWQQFYVTATLVPGSHTIATRASDEQGDSQPALRMENERGYANNSWKDLALTVKVVATVPKAAPPESSPNPAPTTTKSAEVSLSERGAKGRQVFTESQPNCGACHTLKETGSQGAIGPNLDTLRPHEANTIAAVTQGVGIMPSYRETLSAEQIKDLALFLAEATGHKP